MSKKLREFLWFVGVPLATTLAAAMATLDPSILLNPAPYLIGLGINLVRVLGTSISSYIANKLSKDEMEDTGESTDAK